jgi:hypothetical protein
MDGCSIVPGFRWRSIRATPGRHHQTSDAKRAAGTHLLVRLASRGRMSGAPRRELFRSRNPGYDFGEQ